MDLHEKQLTVSLYQLTDSFVHMAADYSTDPSGFVEYRLVRLAERLRRRFDSALGPYGLTARQFSVLAVVQSRPGVTSADLARAVLTTPQSMGAIIDQLETAGLLQSRVRRGRGVPSPTELSSTGAATLTAAAERVTELESETRRLLGADYPALLRILDKLESAHDL